MNESTHLRALNCNLSINELKVIDRLKMNLISKYCSVVRKIAVRRNIVSDYI